MPPVTPDTAAAFLPLAFYGFRTPAFDQFMRASFSLLRRVILSRIVSG
jgi:hypothetical protein